MFLLTLRDLQFRAVRFGIAILGTALVFSMVLLMSGLSAQFRNEPRLTVEGVGADHWIVATGVSGPFTSTSQFPSSVADQVAGDADPIATGRHTASVGDGTKDVLLFGHRPDGIGVPELSEGAQISGSGEVVADDVAGLKLGETTKIGGEEFNVVGLTKNRTMFGGTPFLFMDIDDVQKIVYGGQDVANAIVVRGELSEAPSGYDLLSVEDTWKDALRPLEKPVGAIDAIQILLWLVAATIIGAVVYLSALERRRDFAVMKAVGASSRGLLAGLAVQSILIAIVAAIAATIIQIALVPLFPIPVTVPARAYVTLPILAVAAGALASLGGLRKAVNVDPALAFAGPGG